MINNFRAGLWLLLDMVLHIVALALVKSIGNEYPIIQVLFIRAATGLVLILPWVMFSLTSFQHIANWKTQVARVLFSTLAIGCGYYAVANMPLALFTSLNYLRPAVLMIMAMLVLNEIISTRSWIAVAVGFTGVLIAVQPDQILYSTGLWILYVAVFAGSAATILLRKLKGTPEIVMMVFYTAGLAVISAPLAFVQWAPITQGDMLALAAIGIFSQCAQLCFLRAHWLGEVGFLGPLSYVSLLLSAAVGYFFFNELLTMSLVIGAVVIVFSASLLGAHPKNKPGSNGKQRAR